MLTLIKLINTLNQQILNTIGMRAQPKISGRSAFDGDWAIKFQTVCAVIALSIGGLGSIEIAQAKSLDRQGIRESLQLAANSQARFSHVVAIPAQPASTYVAQNPPAEPAAPTPPDPTTTGARGRLLNNLDLPKTSPEVQITNTQPLTLQEAINTAFRNNRDVQTARLTVERSQAGVTTAKSAQALQVGATASTTNQGAPLFVGTQSQLNNPNSTNLQGGLQATYPILNAGRDASSVRAAEEQVNFDRLDLLRIEQKLRGDVLTAYYDLQDADSSVIINNAAVKDATRSLSDAQLQEKAGVGTKFDILRAQVQLATANQALTTAGGQQQTARKKIAQLLSVADKTEYRAADPVGEAGTWRYSLEDSIILAFKNRPEIKQQLVRRSISEQQQIVAAAADAAQVNLFANYNIGKDLNSSFSAQDNYSLGARLSWNFWDGGAAKSRSYQEKVNQEISENQFTTAKNQVRFEVEQAYNSLGTNRKNIGTATQALQQAEESLKLARLRFQAGVGTQTDVIQAQTELARARGNRVTAILNYNRSLSSLRTATVLSP
jgi:outer membrane protein TolC